MSKYISIDELKKKVRRSHYYLTSKMIDEMIDEIPSASIVEIPESGIEDMSDGYHTFRDLYYQRMVLFATIVKQNKELAWKSLRHEDGELCFDGDWFIVGITTPEGEYTYHYKIEYFNLFDCVELERGKHWDGHTEKDVTRLLSLTKPKETKYGEWLPCNRNGLILTELQRQYGAKFYGFKCSNCNHIYHGNALIECSFCQKCGANMREKEENGL